MAGRGGVDLAGDAQALLDQLLEAPAGAVAGEHGEVVEVDVAVLVGSGDLLIVNLAEPVVGGDGAGVGQDQAAHGVGDGGVLLHAPVVDLHIVVHQLLVVQHGGVEVADLLPLLAVEDVGLGHIGIAGLAEHILHAVLNLFHGDLAVMDLVLIVRSHPEGQQVDDVRVIFLMSGLKSLGNGRADLGEIEFRDLTVSFHNLIHEGPLLSL